MNIFNKCSWLNQLEIILIAISVIIFPCINSYAANLNYIAGEQYWFECKNIEYYDKDNYFDGILKTIEDADDGCFYFFVSFCDKRITNDMTDDVSIDLKITNKLHEYTFVVNKNGIIESNTDDKYITIHSNFEDANVRRKGGQIYCIIEFKNKDDKKLDNIIDCEYFCGKNCTYTLMTKKHFDMTVNNKTTVKTTAKSKNSTKDSVKENPSTTKTVKFTGSGKTYNYTKSNKSYSKSANEVQTKFNSDNIDDNYKVNQTTIAATVPQIENKSTNKFWDTLSPTAKVLIITAGALALAGVAVILAHTIKLINSKNNSTKNNKDEKSSDMQEKSQ